MPSLLDAIETKYGHDGDDCEAPIGIYVPRIGPRKYLPRLLILNACDVDSAGDEKSLQKTCAGVIEIDLAHNRLTQWSEISKILQYTPSVSFLNLSFNNLSSSLTATCVEQSLRVPVLPRLNVLILIGTSITWDTIWFLLKHATTLQEMHLSLNNFERVDTSMSVRNGGGLKRTGSSANTVFLNLPPACNRSDSTDSGNGSSSDDDDGFFFPYLRRLMFDGNPISDWNEIGKLGVCFPSLRHLCLAECSIVNIPGDAYQNFENLQSLSIANTSLQSISDIGRLKKFPSLTDLRIQGVPLLNDMTAHERRQLLVALLPNVIKLNGGAPISHTEREDSERAFIRRYVDSEDKPDRYFELVSIHGELSPLVDVHFKPTTRVNVRICFGENTTGRLLNVYQTTLELKASLESVVGISSAKMKLFYVDADMREVVGREEMRFPQKQLYSYNMHDGDEIHVELKTPVHHHHHHS